MVISKKKVRSAQMANNGTTDLPSEFEGLQISGGCTLVEKISNAEIVIFGEGNFTFSVALAALRGRWDGIATTN